MNIKNIMNKIIFFVILIFPFLVRADFNEGCFGMMGYGSYGGIGAMFMTLFWFSIITGIVVLIYKLINSEKTKKKETSSKAIEILKERYARGEIKAEEYESMKKEIEK